MCDGEQEVGKWYTKNKADVLPPPLCSQVALHCATPSVGGCLSQVVDMCMYVLLSSNSICAGCVRVKPAPLGFHAKPSRLDVRSRFGTYLCVNARAVCLL